MFPHIARVAAPDAAHHDWGWALPSVARLLADPDAHVGFPHCPTLRTNNDEDQFDTAIGYRTALDHLLRFQHGWKQPARCLARWLDRGAPDDCRPPDLANQIWLLAGIRYEFGGLNVPVGPWQLHLRRARTARARTAGR